MREISVSKRLLILHRLREAVRRKRPEKIENQQLVSHSWQCSKTPVGFGQRFLSNERCDNFGTPPPRSPPYLPGLAPDDFYLLPQLKSELKVDRFCDAVHIIKNATEELKCFHRMASRNVPSTFTGACRSVYLCNGTNLNEV
jgi:hypothetical protein